jgi:hypothetical protein
VSISRLLAPAATAACLAGLACGRPSATPAPAAGAAPTATRVLPLEQLFVLEASGVPPEDTVATFPSGLRRRVILRHAAPDYTVFLELDFAPETFAAPGTPDSVTVIVRPRPGVYGADVTLSVPPGPGAAIRFKYPVHFAAPVAALRRYGSAARLERSLAIARRLPSGEYGLLPSSRPASDNLEAPLRGTGTYLVVAPR